MLNLLLILPLLAQATPQDPPQLFRDLSLDEALAAASKERKMVLLDAMTSWCSPCRQMDLTTWRDPELVPWLSERAVCIKLDMDEHGDIKRRLEVRGYPTLIAFRGGVTFDRVLGYKSAAQIRSWIEGLEEGKTDVRRLLERVEAFRDMRIEDVGFEDRRSVAEGLLEHGEDETAGAEFLWLWDNIPHHAPNLAAWRWDVLPGELGPLADRIESLRSRLATQRLALRPLTNQLPAITKLRDWIELNSMLGDDSATAIFCGAALEVDSDRRLIRKLDRRLFTLFIEQGDWRAAGLVQKDPVAAARSTLAGLAAYDRSIAGESTPAVPLVPMTSPVTQPEAVRTAAIPMIPMIPMTAGSPARREKLTRAERERQIRELIEQDMRRSLSLRYGALLAAARRDEAQLLAETLLAHLDDRLSRIALVTRAIAAGVAQDQTERHVRWLEEALR